MLLLSKNNASLSSWSPTHHVRVILRNMACVNVSSPCGIAETGKEKEKKLEHPSGADLKTPGVVLISYEESAMQ